MYKPKIKRLRQQGYSQLGIRNKLGCSKSLVSEVLSKKHCRKRTFRITLKEYNLIKSARFDTIRDSSRTAYKTKRPV